MGKRTNLNEEGNTFVPPLGTVTDRIEEEWVSEQLSLRILPVRLPYIPMPIASLAPPRLRLPLLDRGVDAGNCICK